MKNNVTQSGHFCDIVLLTEAALEIISLLNENKIHGIRNNYVVECIIIGFHLNSDHRRNFASNIKNLYSILWH